VIDGAGLDVTNVTVWMVNPIFSAALPELNKRSDHRRVGISSYRQTRMPEWEV